MDRLPRAAALVLNPTSDEAFRRAVDEAGYSGPIEVEIFNQQVWDTPGDEVLRTIKERYTRCC